MRYRGMLLFGAGCWICVACGGESTTDLFVDGGSSGGGRDGGSGGATSTTGAAGSMTSGGGVAGSGGDGGGAGTTGGGAGTMGGGGATGGVTTGGGAGRGGASGGGGRGGAGGSGGGAPQPECTSAADCKLQNDCCTCEAIAPGEIIPPCPIACLVSKCEAQQLPKDKVACIAGRCVAGFDCDSSKVTCKVLPPVCEAGLIPAVKGDCYAGGCVPVTECTNVKSCADCGKFPCADYATRLGPEAHCVTVPSGCGDNATCACLGPTVCTKPFSSCGDLSGVRGVSCTCPTCL